jgi:putative SOS response-associated peptidase YedK
MCTLYSLRKSPDELRQHFRCGGTDDFPPRPEIRPMEPIGVIRPLRGEPHFALLRWGFIPSWGKEDMARRPFLNARREGLAEKPSFRHALKRRRCLIPADGFFEWQGEKGNRQAWFMERFDGGLFAMAGLWEHWMAPDGSEVEGAVIITTEARGHLAAVHERNPALVAEADFDRWLQVDRVGEAEALHLLAAPADDVFTAAPVGLKRTKPEAPRLL